METNTKYSGNGEKMRILHVVPWYEPAWSSGGTAVAVSTLCRAITKLGINVTVYTTNDAGANKYLNVPQNEQIILGGVNVKYFACGFPFTNWKASMYSRGLSIALSRTIHTFDLVHISSTRHWHGFIAAKLAVQKGIPYIVSPHASLMSNYLRLIGSFLLKYPYVRICDSFMVKNATAIHYLCEGERIASAEYGFGRPSFVVGNGIDLSGFSRNTKSRTKLREMYHISNDCIVLLFIGRIHPLKNIDLIIDALIRIKASPELFRFFIIGPVSDSSYNKLLRAKVRKSNMETVINFLPAVSRDEVHQYYNMADIFVMPSKVEGVSMSILEAMAYSLPILTSNRVANYIEIAKDGAGIIIEPTVDAISDALYSLQNNSHNISKWSHNARVSVIKRNDIKIVSRNMVTAYLDILHSRQTKGLNWIKDTYNTYQKRTGSLNY